MAVIWGLDLKEMQWGKFKNSYMWNTEYHRRRTKFIVYQIAMIFCVVSESLGTAALSDYVDQQDFVKSLNPKATVHNNNFIGIASYNIFVGVYVATIFGSAFFFDLFWPERKESKSVKLAWRICSVLACLFTLSCALAYTEIVAQRSAHITGVSREEGRRLLEAYNGSPMRYRDNGRAIASVVFLWPGMIATFASTYLLWHSLAYIDANGPFSKAGRAKHELPKTASAEDEKPTLPLSHGSVRDDIPAPEQSHMRPQGPRDSSVDEHQRVNNQYGPV